MCNEIIGATISLTRNVTDTICQECHKKYQQMSRVLCLIFDKVDGFISDYAGTEYLVMCSTEKYDTIFNRIRYFIGLNSGITYFFSYNYTKIKFD